MTVVIFYITIYALNHLQDKDALEIEGEVLTCADFSVQIRYLPGHRSSEEMKITLYNWVLKQMKFMDRGEGVFRGEGKEK